MKALLAAILLGFCLVVAAPVRPSEPHSELVCKAYAIRREAAGEPVKGQRAVLDVIHSRMFKSGKTACAILKEPKQFSFYKATTKWAVDEKDLTRFSLLATMPAVVSEANYFHSTEVNPRWAYKFKRVARIGHHIFYKG